MKRCILVFCISVVGLTSFGQSKGLKIGIPYVTLTDTALVSTIKWVISNELNSDEKPNLYKQGHGYICVSITKVAPKDTLRVYDIWPNFLSLRDDVVDDLYPDDYTFINNKLVIIYTDFNHRIFQKHYTAKVKQQIRQLVNATLEKERIVILKNWNGKAKFKDKHFRIETMHMGGYRLFVIKGKQPVITRTE